MWRCVEEYALIGWMGFLKRRPQKIELIMNKLPHKQGDSRGKLAGYQWIKIANSDNLMAVYCQILLVIAFSAFVVSNFPLAGHAKGKPFYFSSKTKAVKRFGQHYSKRHVRRHGNLGNLSKRRLSHQKVHKNAGNGTRLHYLRSRTQLIRPSKPGLRGYLNGYNGPLVIDVQKELAARRLVEKQGRPDGKSTKRITIISGKSTTQFLNGGALDGQSIDGQAKSTLKPHIIEENSGGVRIIYYDDNKCEGGYDCIIRQGNLPSSPKIIIIGKKRAKYQYMQEEESGVKIFYPPS